MSNRLPVGLLPALAAYLILTFSYFFIVPIFEGPDEWTHTGHIKYIAEGNGLPVMLPGRGIWGGQQPPLYYGLGAVLVQPFSLEGLEAYETEGRNPHAALGYALDPGNKNTYLHSPAENFPYRGLSLTVHLLRLYSMAWGLTALIFIHRTALELMRSIDPSNAPTFAAIVAFFVACQPTFTFITASVANEPANIALCAIGLWLAQRYALHGPGRHWGRAAALGITLGLISLAKMTGLSFGLVAVIAILITAIAHRKQPEAARLLWRDGIIIGLLFLAVGGWWYWRNYRLYGDFFQQGLYKIYFNVDPQPLTLSDFLYTLSTGEVSFWAAFGWLNIVAPEWVYSLYRIISRVGLIGLGLTLLMRLLTRWAMPPALLLHLIFPPALAFSLTRLVAIEGGLQGRQLLPALGSVAILVIWGWWRLSPARLRLPLMTLLGGVLFGVGVWLPYGVVAPAYHPPPLLTEADLPPDLNRVARSYNQEMKLIGVKIGPEKVRPGERVPVTAYWQALQPMETNYSVFVHLFGRDGANVGQFNSYPGLGLRPTRSLQPGQIVADTYPVRVEGGSQAPSRLLVNIGLFDFEEPGRPGIPPDETPDPGPVGRLKLVPRQWPAYGGQPPLARFGDHIRLIDCEIDEPVITFKWLATGRPAADYTVFIHLWAGGEQRHGFDSQPLSGDYPTGLWEAGEVILDPHRLDLSGVPPGEYRLLAGLYNLASGERLPATADGQPLLHNALELGRIRVR